MRKEGAISHRSMSKSHSSSERTLVLNKRSQRWTPIQALKLIHFHQLTRPRTRPLCRHRRHQGLIRWEGPTLSISKNLMRMKRRLTNIDTQWTSNNITTLKRMYSQMNVNNHATLWVVHIMTMWWDRGKGWKNKQQSLINQTFQTYQLETSTFLKTSMILTVQTRKYQPVQWI